MSCAVTNRSAGETTSEVRRPSGPTYVTRGTATSTARNGRPYGPGLRETVVGRFWVARPSKVSGASESRAGAESVCCQVSTSGRPTWATARPVDAINAKQTRAHSARDFNEVAGERPMTATIPSAHAHVRDISHRTHHSPGAIVGEGG